MNATTLSVSVTDTAGAPLAGAQVSRIDADRRSVTVSTDERGFARFDSAPTEPATVTVIAPGLAPDSRAIGGGFPTRPDGVEQFVLGPAGWPAYFRGRVRVPFQPVLDAVGVRLDRPADEEVAGQLDGLSDRPAQTIRFDDPTAVVVRLSDLHEDEDGADVARAVSSVRAGRLDDAVRRLNQRADDLSQVSQVGALVALTDRGASFLTDSIVISLLDEAIDPVALATRHGLEVVKRFSALPNTYLLRSPAGAGYDLLDIVAVLAAEPGVRYAEPNLVTTTENDAVTPNDFLFPLQWDHPLIGTPDAWQVLRDLNATNTFGDPAITVGVVDNGVDAGHAVFNVNLSDGQPKISQLFDFGLMVANTSTANTGGQADHGHCCASAAAGAVNEAVGQAGVAGNCHLIAARRGGDEVRYSEAYLWLAGLDADSATAGFPAQLADGADVISSSFGFSVDAPISALMQDTFDAITDQGRGGRGTAMFFSAGNDSVDLDTTNRRPWSMYGRCYGVAASTLANDGVTEIQATYSNFGSTVDFCTPSNDNAGAHNPPLALGAFTATRRDTPRGDAIPGAAVTGTTLSAASAAGTSTITVASVAGAAVDGAVLIGAAGMVASRGRRITAINAGASTLTLDMPLPAAFANGTAVAFAPWEYRSDFGGTSYATPVTAGVAALMYSANPQLSWAQVGDILRATAIKIDPNNANATGRWRDADGRISTDAGYLGPFFSEFYGQGRIDAAAAVQRAAWTIDQVTDAVQFIDIPEGETTYRAVRFDVHSIHGSTFSTPAAPSAPFSMPVGSVENLSGTADYTTVQEAYLWIAYTGSTAGAVDSGSITVRHDQTGQEWVIPINATTVAPKTACVMVVLDRSGSMDQPSGVGANKRIDVLHYSAGILAEAVHEGDGVGIVAFDTDAAPLLIPPVGPLAAPTIFDPDRDTVRSAISSFAVNLAGATSIGDGIALGQSELNPIGGYDLKASVVFTDGYENRQQWIADVGPSITDRTYAVALGRAENIRPATLTAVTKGTGGYCVLTDDLNNDSRYKLAKYFLQVLAGVKNDQIVVDPPVVVPVGGTVDVPFQLAETDVVVDVMFLTQHPWLVDMTLVTPDGDVIDAPFMAGLGGRNYVRVGGDIVYYRLTLPAPIGGGAREGGWLARLDLSEKRLRQAGDRLTPEQVKAIITKGLPGLVLVHASSNLRMDVDVQHSSNEPGAKVRLGAALTEYDVPVDRRAEVTALVTDPAGAQTSITMVETAPGIFREAFVAGVQGVWTVLFHAEGKTFRGTPFTREAIRTVAVWKGGDRYEPQEGPEPKRRRRQRSQDALSLIQADPELHELLSRRLSSSGLSVQDLVTEDA